MSGRPSREGREGGRAHGRGRSHIFSTMSLIRRSGSLLFVSYLLGPALDAAPPTKVASVVGTPAPSLVSLSSGALLARRPAAYGEGWSALWLLDERPESGWASPEGVTTPQSFVVALPERTVLEAVEFDTAAVDCDGCAAKRVVVEVSDTGPEAGFRKVAEPTLKDRADRQQFPVAAEVPGRWVRLTVTGNHGSPEFIELMDFRATGRQLTTTALADVSGTYETTYGAFHVRQEGTAVTGCYEFDGGLLDGGIDGHVLSFTWRETDGKGPAFMAFSPDGKEMLGLWWNEGETDRTGNVWEGRKASAEVGGCPHWTGGVRRQLEKELESSGRARVYGINFDVDSEAIRAESRPTLEKIAALLAARPSWKLSIEGHTDATAGATHNRQLSERRAAAVKAWLVAAGVDGARLATKGLGATMPVATNATPLGRAQNRRVELVRP